MSLIFADRFKHAQYKIQKINSHANILYEENTYNVFTPQKYYISISTF